MRSHILKISSLSLAIAAYSTSALANTMLDVLVVYPEGKSGTRDVKALAASYVNWANQAYKNSRANVQLRLVGVVPINTFHGNTNGNALNRVTNDRTISNLRQQYGADFVSYFAPRSGGTCGVAWVPQGRVQSSQAYSVVATDCGNVAFAHELGHNMALGHSAAQDSKGGIWTWARGHGEQGMFATVMAYGSAYNARNVQYFSNPNVNACKNQPCGRANYTDSVKNINAVATQLADFMPSKQPDNPKPNPNPNPNPNPDPGDDNGPDWPDKPNPNPNPDPGDDDGPDWPDKPNPNPNPNPDPDDNGPDWPDKPNPNPNPDDPDDDGPKPPDDGDNDGPGWPDDDDDKPGPNPNPDDNVCKKPHMSKNMIQSGDFNSLSGWNSFYNNVVTIDTEGKTTKCGRDNYLKVTNRMAYYDGVAQDITNQVINIPNLKDTELEVSVKMQLATEGQKRDNARIALQITDDLGVHYQYVANSSITNNEMSTVKGQFKIDHFGNIRKVQLLIFGPEKNTAFFADEVILRKAGDKPDLGPLIDHGFEADKHGWIPFFGIDKVERTDKMAKDGKYSLMAMGRDHWYSGPALDVKGLVESGQNYQFSFDTRLADKVSKEQFIDMQLFYVDDEGYHWKRIKTETVPANKQWMSISGEFNYQAKGNVKFAQLYIFGPEPGNDFYLDNIKLDKKK
ncbi:carbohydrate binding domain-containing protein [Spartinivicinus ruber]|uniref:carbohydrate binding domain-containing protein n=1 Tax=Spartinivicinus ruber TaxID=2683272 RepID=UPI0013D74F26|nr:carbohydrate binding domain-containing protein [Spartinivicinus ruber]